MKRKEKMLHTKQQWYPNFSGDTVCAMVMPIADKKNPYRVAVWGADDFGLEIDLADMNKALEIYEGLKDNVTQEELRELGFGNA